MGNPSNVSWEGDVFVTVDTPNVWDPADDQVVIHYQFDSHEESSLPSQLLVDLSPGFQVPAGHTINCFRVFVNISPEPQISGDYEVILYYEYA
jgi:hypothetical protein